VVQLNISFKIADYILEVVNISTDVSLLLLKQTDAQVLL